MLPADMPGRLATDVFGRGPPFLACGPVSRPITRYVSYYLIAKLNCSSKPYSERTRVVNQLNCVIAGVNSLGDEVTMLVVAVTFHDELYIILQVD
jgi:hypothetical protein